MSSKMKPIFFTKKLKNPALVLFLFTFLNAKQETIQVTTKNNDKISGRFIGTYMEHIHLLVNNKIVHIHCQSVRSVKKKGSVFSYDCTENTTTPDILFPPKFDPMTGKIVQTIPDFFYPPQVQKQTLKQNKMGTLKTSLKQIKKPT